MKTDEAIEYYEDIGSKMKLQDFLDMKEPETILVFKKMDWQFNTLHKLCGFLQNETVSMGDKVEAFCYIAPLIGVQCTSKDDAIRQIKREMGSD